MSEADEAEPQQSVALSIPPEYAAEFVAEVFEDAERSTDWPTVVDAYVPSAHREAWAELTARAQVTQILDRAAAYDEETVEVLASIPSDADRSHAESRFDEALRRRRNADGFRNAVADAYASGHVGDDALVGAVEDAGFETDTIAEREEKLELVAEKHGFEFRPYGGTLLDEDRYQTDSSDSATW
ncbi:hypothetical protein EGH21_11540 [Halomicroarcula sp. F13]|uniref:Uncharacterized protein n=1 Tax=Haloarcula rubra TaxID=2487747 RepID=A0AAW4PR39_9EURY|nr:hypothetical protein [Halomicroarcula rubra]MBX0323661.1 hypothetical protein [Halomicroarcula rubra]